MLLVLNLHQLVLIEPFCEKIHSYISLRFSLTKLMKRNMSFISLDSLWTKPVLWPETCPLSFSILCDRSDHCGQRHVLHLSRFSVIEAIIVARDLSFTSLDSRWSKQPLWPDTCPLPLSVLCDRSDHCGQWYVPLPLSILCDRSDHCGQRSTV